MNDCNCMWCDVARDMACWDAYASISRVKHVLDGQDVGYLTPNDPPWISMYRSYLADSRAAVGSRLAAPELAPCQRGKLS